MSQNVDSGAPCERFRLDYYLDENRRDQPNARYCVCGWTEAHHAQNDGSV